MQAGADSLSSSVEDWPLKADQHDNPARQLMDLCGEPISTDTTHQLRALYFHLQLAVVRVVLLDNMSVDGMPWSKALSPPMRRVSLPNGERTPLLVKLSLEASTNLGLPSGLDSFERPPPRFEWQSAGRLEVVTREAGFALALHRLAFINRFMAWRSARWI